MIHISPLDICTNLDTENSSNSTNENPMNNIVQSNQTKYLQSINRGYIDEYNSAIFSLVKIAGSCHCRKLEVASPVSIRRELDEPIGETSSSCSPQSSHTSTFSAASGWKVSPIGYWGTIRYPISKCYHIEIIASTSNWYTGR